MWRCRCYNNPAAGSGELAQDLRAESRGRTVETSLAVAARVEAATLATSDSLQEDHSYSTLFFDVLRVYICLLIALYGQLGQPEV